MTSGRCAGATETRLDWRQLVARARAYEHGEAALLFPAFGPGVGRGWRAVRGALKELRASFGQLPLEERLIAAVARHALLSDDQATPRPSRFYRLGMRLLATRRARDGVTVTYRHLARACQTRLQRLATWAWTMAYAQHQFRRLRELFANAADHGAPDVSGRAFHPLPKEKSR